MNSSSQETSNADSPASSLPVETQPFGRAVVWFCAIAIFIALMTLLGWVLGVRFLTAIRDNYFPMPPSTAVLVLLTCIASLSFVSRRQDYLSRYVTPAINLLLVGFTAVILYEYFASIDPGIEERLFGIGDSLNGISLGRMSPMAAVLFFTANVALLLLHPVFSRPTINKSLAALLGTIVVLVGSITMLGYLYGTPLLYGGTTRPIATYAALSFIFLGSAVVLLAGPAARPLKYFVGSRVQPRMLRTFLPITAGIILIDGLLNIDIADQYDVNHVYLSAILAIVLLLPTTVLISRSARKVGGEIDQANARRAAAEDVLRHTVAELERSNAELEQFAYVASHDLQEPLRMISSYVQLIGKRYGDQFDEDAQDFIGFAVDGATRMQDLINDLLTLSRVATQGQPFALVPMEGVLEAALANLELKIEESGAHISHDQLPVLEADAAQLAQLFQNLLENAIKFRGPEPPQIHISVERKDRIWEFCVSDNGIGFEEKFADRIFMVFQRLHARESYPGTGIGLAICKKIVERHHGRIWATSQPREGSTFCFELPEKQRL